jgi:eukaryotic-like serine/threonine-protein kinase
MGSVWRADHLTLNAPVAVKLLDASIAKSEEGQARFLREAQSAAALRSAHVVQTFDYGICDGVPYIVMELMVGDTLSERLAAKGPMDPTIVARLLRQVARAVGKAHQAGIVHRDLKPDNIFLVEGDDDDFTAKVLDFGIAKATAGVGGPLTGSKTRTGALLGTPYYMSPEQAQGTKVIDFRTDLWALGVITYEALLGKRPFDSEALGDLLLKICAAPAPVPSQNGTVPAGFDAWFAKATTREPDGRFQTAADMAKAFTALLEPRSGTISSDSSMSSFGPVSSLGPSLGPSGATLEGSEVTPARLAKQNRTRMMLGAGAAVALLGLVVLLSRGGSKSDAAAHDVPTSAAQAPAKAPPAPEPEPTPTLAPAIPPKDEPTAESSATAAPPATSRTKASGSKAKEKSGSAAAKAAPAAAPAAPKKQESFDPLMMRR